MNRKYLDDMLEKYLEDRKLSSKVVYLIRLVLMCPASLCAGVWGAVSQNLSGWVELVLVIDGTFYDLCKILSRVEPQPERGGGEGVLGNDRDELLCFHSHQLHTRPGWSSLVSQ